jgi:glutaminyl-peptide cyclotransferase
VCGNFAKMYVIALAALVCAALSGCGGSNSSVLNSARSTSGAATTAAAASVSSEPLPGASDAPPSSQTGGFDGSKAYAQVAKLVGFGPHPPASEAIHQTQQYILSQLVGFGCTVDEDSFNAQTPLGNMAMKNIVAKTSGIGEGIILLLTHYDTLRLDNFVGAEDGGSSSGLMLEMARELCSAKPRANAVWIAFLDGEEAQVVENGKAQWSDTDSVYGSRELAARMAVSGDLKRVKAVILADMIGQYNLQILRDTESTPALTDLVWNKAAQLGYGNMFVQQKTAVEDDHGPFMKRGVPSVDIIDLNGYQYWHTAEDTLDKVSAKSLAIVGQVILASVDELQKK